MRDKLGSHWRLRLLLCLSWLVLLGVGWFVGNLWTERVLVPGGYGPPLVMRVIRSDGEILQAYDWTSGKYWKLAEMPLLERLFEDGKSIRVVQGGKAVAWREATMLHVVDISPPHAKRSYRIHPTIEHFEDLVGITQDEQLAVFCRDQTIKKRKTRTPTLPTYQNQVVDLSTGEIRHSYGAECSIAPIDSSDEFASIRTPMTASTSTEPDVVRKSLSSTGELEMVADASGKAYPGELLAIAESSDGTLRLLGKNDTAPAGESITQAVGLATSLSGKRFVALDGPPSRVVLGDTQTRNLIRLPLPYGKVSAAAFLADEETLVVSDLWDDLRVINATTGQTIAGDFAGSRRRWTLVGLMTACLVLAAAWIGVALREQSTAWAMFDLATAVVVANSGSFALFPVFHYRDLFRGQILDDPMMFGVFGLFMANLTAMAILTGWYWVHGHGWIVRRWLQGVVWILCWGSLVGILIPMGEFGDSPMAAIGTTMALSLTIAGVTAAIVLGTRGLGWTLSDKPLSVNPGRFDLASFLTVVAGIAAWFALIRTNAMNSEQPVTFDLVFLRFAEYLIGSFSLIAILFSQTKWQVRVGLLLVLAAVMAFRSYVWIAHYASPIFSGPNLLAIEVGAYLGTIPSITVTCLALRARGWHWRRMSRKHATALVAATA